MSEHISADSIAPTEHLMSAGAIELDCYLNGGW